MPTLELHIPEVMIPDILALKDQNETLHDCVLDLMWIGALRLRALKAGVVQSQPEVTP